MPFFKDLKRRSKASIRNNTERSSNESGESNGDSSVMPSVRSSSTLSSLGNGTITPPPGLAKNMSSSSLSMMTMQTNGSGAAATPLPQRPRPLTSQVNRYSMVGVSSSTSQVLRSPPPTSAHSPKILSISDNSWVNQKVLLISGQIGETVLKPLDGNLIVHHHQDSFPATTWPVTDSTFKALIHLNPGPNKLRLEFASPKLSSKTLTQSTHTSWISINYLPLNNAPPLQLAILMGKDSPGTFDATPERAEGEGNDLETAIRKYRMAAYLWQAFTGEQMNRNGFGRRCFRYEEEWQTGTLTLRDMETGQMRNEAKIHVIRSERTVAELRDLQIAQQHGPATKKGDLHGIAMNDVKNYFKPLPGQKHYVSVLLLDSHWDPSEQTIRAHAALGGGTEDLQVAIFGSHALQSYPSALEEVVPAFLDTTPTDTKHVANDCGESGSSWEAANIGIGAHLHEVGHVFGCPHQENGIMLRDYVRLNRTFVTREPYSTRTGSEAHKLTADEEVCTWHRLDALRFRFHPCFRLPSDPPVHSDDSVSVWPIDNGRLLITAQTGIPFIEIYTEGQDLCKTWIENLNNTADGVTATGGVPRQITLTEAEIRAKLPADQQKTKSPLKLVIFSGALGKHEIIDFAALFQKSNLVKLPHGATGFRSKKLGRSELEGSMPEEVILEWALKQTRLCLKVKVYFGYAVDGLEFFYEDKTSQLFGKRGGGTPGEFLLDIRRGEFILGFYIRAGLWIDGIEILTNLGRKSGVFGNAKGGNGHTLIPPRGYNIAGIAGSCGPWLDGFQLIIQR